MLAPKIVAFGIPMQLPYVIHVAASISRLYVHAVCNYLNGGQRVSNRLT